MRVFVLQSHFIFCREHLSFLYKESSYSWRCGSSPLNIHLPLLVLCKLSSLRFQSKCHFRHVSQGSHPSTHTKCPLPISQFSLHLNSSYLRQFKVYSYMISLLTFLLPAMSPEYFQRSKQASCHNLPPPEYGFTFLFGNKTTWVIALATACQHQDNTLPSQWDGDFLVGKGLALECLSPSSTNLN